MQITAVCLLQMNLAAQKILFNQHACTPAIKEDISI
jgi:hypothetical protein